MQELIKDIKTYRSNMKCYYHRKAKLEPSLNVNPLPTGVSFSGLDSTYCSTDAYVTMTGSPAGGIFTGTGGVADNEFYPATGVNTYVITYTYTDSMDCSSSSSQSVEVLNCTGIAENEEAFRLKVYPNPNTGFFKIELAFKNAQIAELIIVNSLGQEIFTQSIAPFEGVYAMQVNLNQQSPGIYHLQLISESGVANTRLIIQ